MAILVVVEPAVGSGASDGAAFTPVDAVSVGIGAGTAGDVRNVPGAGVGPILQSALRRHRRWRSPPLSSRNREEPG